MSTALPRLVIAAPASGQGKTTVSVGIMAALSARGLQVAPAKVGPDYIDPGYHALATGRPGRNLDPWLLGEELIAPMLAHAMRSPSPADLALIEGVMGLHDGQIGGSGFASTAHVALLTDSPILLVVDISHAARTIGALVHGLRTWPGRDGKPAQIVGVVLNKAGSPRHADEARLAVEGLGLPVVGALPRDAGVTAPSRHLGLVPVAERADAAAALDQLAAHTEEHLDLDLIVELARQAPPWSVPPWSPQEAIAAVGGPSLGGSTLAEGTRPRVAVAGGRAFTFRYPETDELLRAAGCEPVIFDPALDSALPADCAGLYLGGGFPEMHATALATNTSMLASIRAAVAAGMPTVAECAGLLYLCEAVDGHRFVGAVPANAQMQPRLTLRYLEASTAVDSIVGPAGTSIRGHEFHRTGTMPTAGATAAWLAAPRPGATPTPGGSAEPEELGFALDPAGRGQASVHASYLHVSWAGNPVLAASFADAVHEIARTRAAGGTVAPEAPAAAAVAAGLVADVLSDPLDHHGDRELSPGLIDFAVNVRQSAPPAWLAAQINAVTPTLAAYPQTSATIAALARAHGVPESMVLPTSGAAEAFTLIARGLSARNPLIVHPQFTEPEAALRRAGSIPGRAILEASTGFALTEAVQQQVATGGHDLVIVGNPTNPTGVAHAREALLAMQAPGSTLVVDEAFLDALSPETQAASSLISASMPGVLVLRSITKTWALAGLRAGYVIGDPALIARLAAQQTPWSVSSAALAALSACTTPAALREAAAMNEVQASWRSRLVTGLEKLGLEPVPGEAPFVLVQVGSGVRERLRAAGYALRRADSFPGLDESWVRIAVRDPLTTDGLVRALGEVLAQGQANAPSEPLARPRGGSR